MLIGYWMTARKANPKTNWKRVSNCPGGKGTQPRNKYQFSTHLKKVGDFIMTEPLNEKDLDRIFRACHIWSYRHHCRVKTEIVYFPEGKSLLIEVISNTRKERK